MQCSSQQSFDKSKQK